MTNEQLYLAVGVPIVMNMLFNGIMFLVLNKRMDDLRDSMRREIDALRAELRAELHAVGAEVKAEIAKLAQRIERLEERGSPIVRG